MYIGSTIPGVGSAGYVYMTVNKEIRRENPPGMVLKPVVNNGISTTCPSTGEFAGFLNQQQYVPSFPINFKMFFFDSWVRSGDMGGSWDFLSVKKM